MRRANTDYDEVVGQIRYAHGNIEEHSNGRKTTFFSGFVHFVCE